MAGSHPSLSTVDCVDAVSRPFSLPVAAIAFAAHDPGKRGAFRRVGARVSRLQRRHFTPVPFKN